MILYKNGQALINGKLVKTDIVANHGRIIEISPDIVADEQTEVIDCSHRYILPALVDLHTHGANGYDFNTADVDGMRKIMEFYISHGVGTVFPTVRADSDDVICQQVALIAQLSKDYPEIKGIHLEGPFLSKQYCDDISTQYLQKPSMDKFVTYQKSAEGKIKLITVAPELPDALAFISEVTDSKVVVSLGHSGADGETVNKALKAGAKCFTHWGNAMSPLSEHNLNMMGTALLSNAYAEVECSDERIDKDVLRLLLKAKGIDKLIGITNSSKTNTIDAYQGLANFVSYTGLPLPEAIKIWTVNPAKLVGLSDRIGTIEVGKDADFIIFG